MARVKYPNKFVKGSNPGANGIIGAVKNVGAAARAVNTFPGIRTPNPRPPGNPTGKGYVTG